MTPPTAATALQALTAAAALLPGLAMGQASLTEVELQYGRFQEEPHNLLIVPNTRAPVTVDSLHSRWGIRLGERTSLTLNYGQDTWSGATPVATAPLLLGGNRPVRQGTVGNLVVVGASPYITGTLTLDRQGRPLQRDASGQWQNHTQLVHTLASASPETRRQWDADLALRGDHHRLLLGYGESRERDYRAYSVRLGGDWTVNDQLTTLNAGLRYGRADIAATLDHDAAPYITKTAYTHQIERSGSREILRGDRRDWGVDVGVAQVLHAGATLELGLGYADSRGYLANPYKLMTVAFVDPAPASSAQLNANVQALLEQRPARRQQATLLGHYTQYVAGLDAAWHLRYQYSRDSWGVKSHAAETEWVQPLSSGWTVTPRLRYYTQTAADFYQPWLLSQQAYRTVTLGPGGSVTIVPFTAALLPSHFSSDQRLAGFGSLQAGVTVSRTLASGWRLQATVERYQQAARLQWRGQNNDGYSDGQAWMASLALKLDLAEHAAARRGSAHVHAEHGQALPAGLANGHPLPAGAWMVGYRFRYSREAGAIWQGRTAVSEAQLLSQGCAGKPCYSAPSGMSMRMHMLELMYAPRDDLIWMVMPQWMDMQMTVRGVSGAPPAPLDVHVHNAPHDSGGLGDTGFAALLGWSGTPQRRWQLGLGLSAPTGATDLRLRRTHQIDPGLVHYGMQTGSGTWDFKPSLTHVYTTGALAWGQQLSATLRLQSRNRAGYALGNTVQATTWLSYQLGDGIAASLRALHHREGAIRGHYGAPHPASSPADVPGNYGGRYWDIGVGLNVGSMALEWLQPVHTQVNGYQLQRRGGLALNWQQMF